MLSSKVDVRRHGRDDASAVRGTKQQTPKSFPVLAVEVAGGETTDTDTTRANATLIIRKTKHLR